jgi:hypothetical protein
LHKPDAKRGQYGGRWEEGGRDRYEHVIQAAGSRRGLVKEGEGKGEKEKKTDEAETVRVRTEPELREHQETCMT